MKKLWQNLVIEIRYRYYRISGFFDRCPKWLKSFSKIVGILLLCFLGYLAMIGLYWGSIMLISSIPVEYELQQSTEQIEKIELVYVEWGSKYYEGHDSKIVPRKELDEEQWAAFLKGFNEIPRHRYANDPPDTIFRDTIHITYRDGSCEMICDRPFLFMIKNRFGVPLFMGIYTGK